MRLIMITFILSFATFLQGQDFFALENLVDKDTASDEFRSLLVSTKMEELADWRRMQNGAVIEMFWIFKGTDYHGRITAKRSQTGNLMKVSQLTFYNPDKSSPKVKGNTCKATLPFGFQWDMTQADVKKIIGNSNDPWVRFQGFEVQCSGFTERSNYKMNTFHIRKATEIKYNPPLADTQPADKIPAGMAKVFDHMRKQGYTFTDKETVQFTSVSEAAAAYRDIPLRHMDDIKSYGIVITLENTIGGYVHLRNENGDIVDCKLMPFNDEFMAYAPSDKIRITENMFVRVLSDGFNTRSLIKVYYFKLM